MKGQTMNINQTEQRAAATATKSIGVERRGFKAELRVSGDPANPRIVGMAALYNTPSLPIGGQFVETLEKGAFRDVLATKPDVLALWNHDANHVLGRSTAGTLKLSETARGLAVEIDPPDATWSKDLLVSMKRGDVHQMSFSFSVEARDSVWTEDKDGTQRRSIKRISLLHDVSIVARPAYPQTSATARKHVGPPLTVAQARAKMAEQDRRWGLRTTARPVAAVPSFVMRELAESRARRQRLADRAARDPYAAHRLQLAEQREQRRRAEGNVPGAIFDRGYLRAPE